MSDKQTPNAPNSFDVMKRMSADNKDILMFPDLVDMRTVKQGGHITFGVPAEFIDKLMLGIMPYKVFALALNEEQYKEVSALLARETESGS